MNAFDNRVRRMFFDLYRMEWDGVAPDEVSKHATEALRVAMGERGAEWDRARAVLRRVRGALGYGVRLRRRQLAQLEAELEWLREFAGGDTQAEPNGKPLKPTAKQLAAIRAWQAAIAENPDLKAAAWREVYDYLVSDGVEVDGEPYKPGGFDSWKKLVQRGLNKR